MLDALRDLMGSALKNVKLNDEKEGSVASGGHHHLWRIHNGVDKTSAEPVSVFICDKQDLTHRICGDNKKHAAEVIAWVKQGCSQLCKLQHPHVLRVISPLVETNKILYIVTEQVFASLSNAFLKNFENINKVSPQLRDFDLSLVEKQYGLYQIADAMQFLLTYAGLCHMNFTPESVYISKKGEWKVSEFLFSTPVTALAGKTQQWNQNFRNTENLTDTHVQAILGPNMNYAAPEYVLRDDPSPGSCDCFSFGCVTYDVLRAAGSAPLINARSNLTTYQQEVDRIHHRKDNWGGIDESSRQTIISLTHRDVSQRVDFVKLVTTAPLFGDSLIRCLIYVSRMSAQDAKTKMPFLKTLYDSVKQYSPRILVHKIIPSLLPDLADERMFRFILPILFACVSSLEGKDVEALLMPAVGPIMLRKDLPVVTQIVLERFTDLMAKVSLSSLEKYIIPFLANALTVINDPRVIVPLVGHVITYTETQLLPQKETKDRLLPLMISLLTDTSSPLDTKVCILTAVPKLFFILDTETVKTKVEPALHGVLTTERDAKLLMMLVDVYSAMAEKFGKEMTVHIIVPSLCPLLLSTTLHYDQVHTVAMLISKLIMQIDAERKGLMEAAQRAQYAPKPATAEPEVTQNFDNFNAHGWKPPTIEAPKLPQPQQPPASEISVGLNLNGDLPSRLSSTKNAWADFSDEPPVKLPSSAATSQKPSATVGDLNSLAFPFNFTEKKSSKGDAPTQSPPTKTSGLPVSKPQQTLQQSYQVPTAKSAFDDMDDFFGTKK